MNARGATAGIAAQIRLQREARQWSQEDLAARCGMKQASVSRLESPDYGRFSLATLVRLAEAFDMTLVVCFRPKDGALLDSKPPGT